ncbi:hypothetical protein [Fischerella muscicola]|uniref:hypothetical protein n=1 Tax=Fischerella TaxID=1190 RepID=UPI00035C844B
MYTQWNSYLFALTQALYGRSPQAWWVKVPGVNFELGESLSPVAEQGIEIALQKINHLLNTISKEQYKYSSEHDIIQM